jgi:hypothetical protein
MNRRLPSMNRAASNHPIDEESLTDTERQQLRRIVDEIGERDASRHLAVSRQTLGRAIAGLPLHLGTVILVRQRLSAWEAVR